MIRVVLADDQALFRAGIRMVIDSQPDLQVVGEASDGEDAVRCFEALDPPPSAVVLDERMPSQSGLATAEQILALRPNQIIVLFSAALDAEVVSRALGVGVQQCVDKLETGRLPRVLRVLLGEDS